MPSSMTATISSVVAIGRRMKGADIAPLARFRGHALRAWRLWLWRGALDLDAAAVLQPIVALGDDLLALGQPAIDHRAPAKDLADHDGTKRRSQVRLCDPDKIAARAVSNRDGVHRDGAA